MMTTYRRSDLSIIPDGEFVDAWAQDRIVARDNDIGPDKVDVSTVFLVIDHGFGRHHGGKPVLFETMVFKGKHDQEMDRYHTEAEAMAGHAEVVFRVEQGKPPFKGTR